MLKVKTWFKENKKKGYIYIGVAVAVIAIIIGVAIVSTKETVTVRQTEIVAEVNIDFDKQVETYLDGVKHPDEATVNFDEVDTTKLGEYEGTIQYKDETYTFKFTVKDTVKPIIVVAKDTYTFPLDTTFNEVNEAINADIKVTDNYDKEFDPIEVISEVPESESELKVAITVKDTSENVSDSISVVVQFTEEGEEKADLEQVEKTANKSYSPKEEAPVEEKEQPSADADVPSAGNGGNTASNGGGTGGGSSDVTPKPQPTPQPDPTPQPEPTPTPPAPEVPSYTTPAGALDGGLFNSEQEGIQWAFSHMENPNSPYYFCELQGNSFSNGQWHFYVEACNK